jgi:hypothetical protein
MKQYALLGHILCADFINDKFWKFEGVRKTLGAVEAASWAGLMLACGTTEVVPFHKT